MSARRRAGEQLPWKEVRSIADCVATGEPVGRPLLASAVRTLVASLAADHPGRLIELRVPPFAAAQLGDGSEGVHRRGTPPNVVETDATTLLGLASGRLHWEDAVASGRLHASGTRSDLSGWFPHQALNEN